MYSKEQIYNDSYILIGPMGSGKTLISSSLGKKLDMPVITLDMMCHCPHSIEEIEKEHKKLKNDKISAEKERELCTNREEYNHLTREINSLENDIWVCEKRAAMRKLLPNLPNFHDLGFKGEVADYLDKNFGGSARLFYRKQFENKMLQSLIEQLPCPCVIDMGGTMSVAMEDEYQQFAQKFEQLDKNLFYQNFDLNNSRFDIIEQALKPFKHVVALSLPTDYKQATDRAAQDPYNEKFIQSGQYERLATQIIDVSHLVQDNKINREKLYEIVNTISSQNQNNMVQNFQK